MSGKSYLLTSILSIGFALPSCVDQCENINPVKNSFDIEGIELNNYPSDAVPGGALPDSSAVNGFSYRLNLDFMVSYFDVSAMPKPGFNFSLMNEGLARCIQQDPGYLGSKEKIKSMEIVALTDFDADHLAGSTINEFFELFSIEQGFRDLNQFLLTNLSFVKEETIVLRLKKMPELDSYFKVRVDLELENGETYSTESLGVVLQ
jgi:hypothetical protein